MSVGPGLPSRQIRLSTKSGWTKFFEAIGAVFVVFFFVVGTILLTGLLLAWPVMIALGVWHSYYHEVPALGWLATFISVVAVHSVFHAAKYEKKQD